MAPIADKTQMIAGMNIRLTVMLQNAILGISALVFEVQSKCTRFT